jgi:branched-chain amino acid transport system ATP-binding protein
MDEGEIIAIIGANGAGKSTTLRAISGLLRPTEGSITFRGERIDRLSPHSIVRRGVAHVPEGRRLFPSMTTRENLELGAYLRRGAGVRRDLESVRARFPILKNRGRQRAGSLSGGEQQMLAIGRALMARPSLLLLDEPSIGLAPLVVKEIAAIITDITQQDGVGIILVEQNASLALSVAPRAYVMELGRINLAGPSAELVQDEKVRTAYLAG